MGSEMCIRDSPFFVLPCQPAYVCPVLSAPSLVCRTEGVLKFYSFARPPERYSVQQLLLLLCMLKSHVYCCLQAVFFVRFCLSLPRFACLFFFVYLGSVSILQSRSCLASFRCPAVSACLSLPVCVPFFERPLSCAVPRVC